MTNVQAETLLELTQPQQEVFDIFLVLPSYDGKHAAHIFLNEEDEWDYIREERGGNCSCSSFYLHHLGDLKYAFDGFGNGLEDGKSPAGTYLYGVERDGLVRWHFTVDERECSIQFDSLAAMLVQLDNRLAEIDQEHVDAHYDDHDEAEGPYGGAFRDQEDYENYRFGGISYLNSI